MFTWSTVHVIYSYVDNAFISEDESNSPKEYLPSPLPHYHPKICTVIVPGIIRYANTFHFIILFVDVASE